MLDTAGVGLMSAVLRIIRLELNSDDDGKDHAEQTHIRARDEDRKKAAAAMVIVMNVPNFDESDKL
jgi:hypothetical protein